MPGVAQRAHQPSRQGADVGAPVPADLGLVAHAAERHAHELASGGAGDRLADRGLAGARRADQREDRPGLRVGLDTAVLAQLAHRQVLGDAVLDVLQDPRGRRRAPRAPPPDPGAPQSACSTAINGAAGRHHWFGWSCAANPTPKWMPFSATPTSGSPKWSPCERFSWAEAWPKT